LFIIDFPASQETDAYFPKLLRKFLKKRLI
jgi:hypothetical protein